MAMKRFWALNKSNANLSFYASRTLSPLHKAMAFISYSSVDDVSDNNVHNFIITHTTTKDSLQKALYFYDLYYVNYVMWMMCQLRTNILTVQGCKRE